jgi:hypothetical protein
MKKTIIFVTIFALSMMSVIPALAATISTGLTQDTSGGATPIVKAKWEMNIAKGTDGKYLGTDDSTSAGAQFMPSGTKDVNKRIALCSIVTDPDGLADINNVYADVFYPKNVALGTSHIPLPNQSNLGCGELMQEDALTVLSKADGIALFCARIRNNNFNLPTIQSPYSYDEICKADGELMKETAAVYCGEKDLSYEDPSGSYKVWAVAQDKVGLQGTLENHFDYLALTAFETDFTAINYGNVRLNTHKIINGDLTWGAALASIRNIGNTRAQISVNQNDMGFGKTNGLWNVKYDARIGSDAAFAIYDPDVTTVLNESLDLSELNEMDFSIDVSKFPPTHVGPYVGTMTLSAGPVAHLVCGQTEPGQETRHISLENKNTDWQVLSDDQVFGDIGYSHNYNDFHGVVTGTGLIPGGKYQITLNGPGGCTFTDAGFAGIGPNAFSSGYWNNNTNLEATCSTPGEGVYNMSLINDHYTFIADGSGAFSFPFAFSLPAGNYSGVKVLVKKMLDTHVAPWADTGTGYSAFNLYETAPISFTVLP